MVPAATNGLRVWSVGHSTHSLDTLVELLERNEIAAVADVRTVPKSRRHPQFHTDALARTLPARGIGYRPLPRLGGWRQPATASPNTGWRNRSFQGYADYALSDEFAAGLAELCDLAAAAPTAMMCAEALWWRCHRRLIADRLVVAGAVVCHIGSGGRPSRHALTPFASVDGTGRVTYPPV